MGVQAAIVKDELVVEGQTLVQRLMDGKLLKSGAYTSHHDHRMVMALKVASLGADGPITIDDESCVAKSFPQFHELFEKLM
jgi:3-phosphoshikimate 1-carboxyvinyltransferase